MDIINNINKSDDTYNTINNLSIDNLEKAIIYASDKYYNDEPVITDAIFDMLRDFLNLKASKSKVLKQIGAPVKSIDKVKLPYYLGSMDKIKPPSNKLDKWTTDYKPPYIATDKLDGVSALIVYKDDIKMYTRGTATHGQDITPLLRYMKNIPKYDDVMSYIKKNKLGNMIAFRGELIISKEKFTNWMNEMKNARNAVAGLVNSKNINPKLTHDTSLVLYEIIDPVLKPSIQLETIREIGFKTVHSRIFNKLSFKLLSKYLIKRREKSKYVIDGIIITNDYIHEMNTDGNPEYSWAFKDALDDMKAISKIIDIEWNQSKDGNIIPTIIIDPVDIGGVTIKRITGNNAKNIVDNMLGIGAEVEVIRSNDVIPKIERVIKGVKPKLPEGEWDNNMVHLKSDDMETDDINIKNIYYFFSTLDTMGLGEKVIEKLYNAGHDTILKILTIKKEDIIEIEGFKEKSAENIVNNIKKSTSNIPLAILMKASNKLGRGMGEERAKDVIIAIPNIMTDYKKYTVDELTDKLKTIDGWEEKTSRTFASNFQNFIDFYNSIKKYISIEIINKPSGTKFDGVKIVMSGFRDNELEKLRKLILDFPKNKTITVMASLIAEKSFESITRANPSVIRYIESQLIKKSMFPSTYYHYVDPVSDALFKVHKKNTSNTFGIFTKTEIKLFSRGLMRVLERPFVEMDPIAGSKKHRKIFIKCFVRLFGK